MNNPTTHQSPNTRMSKLVFFQNDTPSDVIELSSRIDIRAIIVDYIHDKVEWVYGTDEDFYEWLGTNEESFINVRNGVITIHNSVSIDQIILFIELWNNDFGDSQKVSYELA